MKIKRFMVYERSYLRADFTCDVYYSTCAYGATHIVVDEVQVVSRSDSHQVASSLEQPEVSLVEGLMDIDKCIDNGVSMSWRRGYIRADHRNHLRRNVLGRENKVIVQSL